MASASASASTPLSGVGGGTTTTAGPAWSNPHETPSSTSVSVTQQPQQTQQQEDPAAFLSQPYSTLDEPVIETIMRDVRAVSSKLKVVLMPLSDYSANLSHLYAAVDMNITVDDNIGNDNDEETNNNNGNSNGNGNGNNIGNGNNETQKMLSTLKNWDLFGPLIVCLLLSIVLSMRAPSHQSSAVFASVFCSMWMGSAVVTINAKLLGANISFFQSVCILGYSVFPFCLSAFIIFLLQNTLLGHVWLDIIWVIIGYIWATRASVLFIGQFVPKERRFLAVFPVFFYYTLLGWLVLLF